MVKNVHNVKKYKYFIFIVLSILFVLLKIQLLLAFKSRKEAEEIKIDKKILSSNEMDKNNFLNSENKKIKKISYHSETNEDGTKIFRSLITKQVVSKTLPDQTIINLE
ncbi:hypothetical protein [Candidatus Phytoplasma sacchari]|uniref:Uncharacterized protein n=1 Tax=Candidatus Phytoplasma sacchari TaxID=2609813 RepID=A0ABY7M176_9MOLU|nr:hypothetical protein O7R10_00170 [Candidatus Phytoplasma sacchari]